MLALSLTLSSNAQQPATASSEPHQMLVTKAGFLAIDTPKGWVQREGPGLAFFLPEGIKSKDAQVWMYISAAPIGPNEEDKDSNSYIQSDISEFKKRFKNATVTKEEPLVLPEVKQTVSVYTFQSGETHNAYEQIIYIQDVGRDWLLALSANNSDSFQRSKQAFYEFAKSYRGSILMGSAEDKH